MADHPLKGKWHSFLVGPSTGGAVPVIKKDGTNHEMDLTNMTETGELPNGTHNGKTIKGKAVSIQADRTFFLTIDYVDGTRRYEGFLVRDKTIEGNKIKLVAGRFIFLQTLQGGKLFEVTADGALFTSQEEGTWIITHP